jgi:hypothetical protein
MKIPPDCEQSKTHKSSIGAGPLAFMSVRAAGQAGCVHIGEPGRATANCNPDCNRQSVITLS